MTAEGAGRRPRNHRSAKKAGARFERQVADYLAAHVDDRIDRRVKTGAADKGDIGGVRLADALGDGRVAVECKDTSAPRLAAWASEVEAERINDLAVAGVVVHKRRGTAATGRQWVSMTLADLVALLTGTRPDPDATRRV